MHILCTITLLHALQNRLVSFDSWYTTKVKYITEFTESSFKVLQEAVMQHTTGRVDRLTMDELAGVVGLVPQADVPLNLVPDDVLHL